jgi:hypothetical protein
MPGAAPSELQGFRLSRNLVGIVSTSILAQACFRIPPGRLAAALMTLGFALARGELQDQASRGHVVTLNTNQVLEIDGRKVFPIGFSLGPPPEGMTPEGKPALAELAEAGALFVRTGARTNGWSREVIEAESAYLDAAARHGMFCWPYLRELASIGPTHPTREELLRKIVTRFRHHPALLAWKGADEPEWGKLPLPPLLRAREILRELDPHHPMVTIHAPRGTVESLRPYNDTADILGADIYPVSYPPGIHSLSTNKTLGLVGEHTRLIREVADGRLPVWMVLQISWSGVLKPGKTLRFPTFPEERFMTYQAIINGARGLVYFGGHNVQAMGPQDARLGWNWTFWRRVLRPVIEEIGVHSPLAPALVAPDSSLPLRATGATGLEFCAREVGADLFVLACKDGGETARIEFSGLPPGATLGEVLYESPRTVEVKSGRFSDWFAPYEVHVYRFRLPAPPAQ